MFSNGKTGWGVDLKIRTYVNVDGISNDLAHIFANELNDEINNNNESNQEEDNASEENDDNDGLEDNNNEPEVPNMFEDSAPFDEEVSFQKKKNPKKKSYIGFLKPLTAIFEKKKK